MDWLARHDLSFDWADQEKQGGLPGLKKLALKYPMVRIVMDHFGQVLTPQMDDAAVEKETDPVHDDAHDDCGLLQTDQKTDL